MDTLEFLRNLVILKTQSAIMFIVVAVIMSLIFRDVKNVFAAMGKIMIFYIIIIDIFKQF